jgi:hypothetical protein
LAWGIPDALPSFSFTENELGNKELGLQENYLGKALKTQFEWFRSRMAARQKSSINGFEGTWPGWYWDVGFWGRIRRALAGLHTSYGYPKASPTNMAEQQ